MTPMTTLSLKHDPGIALEDLYRLSVAQYHALAPVLVEDAPVELLEGWLVCKYGLFDAFPSPYLAPEAEEAGDLTLAWIWRFTVDEYHALRDAGILTEDDPVELLGGWLVRKRTQKPPHPIAVELTREALASRLSRPWYVRTQAPITLADGEPAPDVAMVRGDRRDYLQRHPGPSDVVLVVEVADTSLARDRGIKKQTYALAGIPVYWIVNLTERKDRVLHRAFRRRRGTRLRPAPRLRPHGSDPGGGRRYRAGPAWGARPAAVRRRVSGPASAARSRCAARPS